jgi:hypothetical protein
VNRLNVKVKSNGREGWGIEENRRIRKRENKG